MYRSYVFMWTGVNREEWMDRAKWTDSSLSYHFGSSIHPSNFSELGSRYQTRPDASRACRLRRVGAFDAAQA